MPLSGDRLKFERLPEIAFPLHYALHLAPNINKFSFEGHVDIDVEIVRATDVLKLHAKCLDISRVVLITADETIHSLLGFQCDEKWNMLTIQLPSTIAPQKVKLSIDFLGKLNDKMSGFYISSYKNEQGKEKFMAATHFESTYARTAFPCWDEPIYKATFAVSLTVPSVCTALSNMNAVSEFRKSECLKLVSFACTPRMSTYLLAFVVGELDYLECTAISGTVIRLYTMVGKKEQGAFGLDLAARALDWYNEWFGIPYPLPKCDLVAIPDFSWGAMENWGLVTYREVTLLVDPLKSSAYRRSRIALIIAHELAHFWFGNLVTMYWWNDLWLKEGFASFMSYLFVGSNYPELNIWQQFLNDEVTVGLNMDSLRSSHAIEVGFSNPNTLTEIFDSITYAKSNCVIRMLYYYLGEMTFQEGLRLYLKKYQFGNATTRDLWNVLSEASGEDINALMSSWTTQMGFPLISVEQRQEGRYRILNLRQQRFIADGGNDENESIWQIPITVNVGSNPTSVKCKFLLTEKAQTFTIENVEKDDWVKLNAGASGFFRVEYSGEILDAFFRAFTSKNMPVSDCFNIASDLFALVACGRTPTSQFFSLLEASVDGDELVVWRAIDKGLVALSTVLVHADTDGSLKNRFDMFVAKTLTPVGERLGWLCNFDEESQKNMVRSLIQERLAMSGHSSTIKMAMQIFSDHLQSRSELHADLRQTLSIYTAAVRYGDDQAFDEILHIYETDGFGEVESHCLIALSHSQNCSQLKRLFEYGVKDGKVRSQDLMYLFHGMVSAKVTREFVWLYFKENINFFLNRLGGVNAAMFQRCLQFATHGYCTEIMATEVKSFFCSYLDPVSYQTLDRLIRQVTESIQINKVLLEKNAPFIEKYLCSKGY